MALRKLTMLMPVAALLVGCQSGQKTEREQQLEQRVQELEQRLTASPSPAEAAPPVAETAPLPAAGPEAPVRVAPLPVERTRAPRPPVASRAGARRAEAAPLPTEERVERIPSAEPADDDTPEPGSLEQVEPRPTRLVLPRETELTLVLEEELTSDQSREGDAVTARVERAVGEDGRIVLPGGTVLRGKVTEALSSGRVKGRARVAVTFDRIVVRGVTHELDATPIMAEAAGESGRDAKVVGGAAAAGAILGAITGGKKGAVKGTVLGGAAGGAAVLLTKGREVQIPAGSRWTVRLRDSLRL
jgi:type IV secretory pathway VirB10-like protein